MTSIRLNSTIQFDENTEKDIIDLISSLNSCHKTGQFLGTLIRLAVDNPEVFKRDSATGRYNTGELYNYLGTNAMSKNRADFFNALYKEVLELKTKVDAIYKMSLEERTLAQFGKHIGLEDKSRNTMRAGFLLEKQLADIQNVLGDKSYSEDSIYMSNKLTTSDKVVSDIVAFIINTYGDIVDEIKSSLTVPVQVQTVQVPVQTQQVETPAIAEVINETRVDNKTKAESTKSASDNITVFDGDEVIDFGSEPTDADIDALANFFGAGG